MFPEPQAAVEKPTAVSKLSHACWAAGTFTMTLIAIQNSAMFNRAGVRIGCDPQGAGCGW